MIRQICPHCEQSVEFTDEAAGSRQACPACGQEFAIPGRYTPAVDPTLAAPPEPKPEPPLPAPPGFVPPGSRPTPPPPGTTSAPSSPRPGARSLVLRPSVLDWFPAGCFTLILFLTLFPWVGLFPGGHESYSQGAWGASVGRFATDSFAESVMRLQTELGKRVHTNWVMLIYLLGLIGAVALSWLDRALTPERPVAVPRRLGIVETVWPHRFPILAGLAVGLLALILIQTYAGFGLDTATERLVAAEFAQKAADAPPPAAGTTTTAADEQTREIRQGMALGQYEVHTTFWLGLAIGTHLVAVAAVALRLWLYRRGNQPPPRLSWEA